MKKVFFSFLFISLLLPMLATAQDELTPHETVIRTIQDIFIRTDQRDWSAYQDLFADEFTLDYTSLNGGSPSTMAPAELQQMWEKQLGSLKATHHMITNLQVEVDSDRATVFSYVTATHYYPNSETEDTWTVYGTYDHELERTDDGWRVTLMRYNHKFAEGDQQILSMASGQ